MIPHTAPPVWPEPRPGAFAGSILASTPHHAHSPRDCRVALLGLADDTGVTMNGGRPGARNGPRAFRAALARYGTTTPNPPHYPRVFDAGDVVAAPSLDETHERVTRAAAAILELGLFPVAIGGGHDLTFPFVRAVAALHNLIHGVYIDAHLDVRAEPGSGMPFRALVERCGVASLTCIGVSETVNSREHFDWFAAHGGRAVPTHALPSQPDDARFTDRLAALVDPTFQSSRSASDAPASPPPLFVSLDLDAIDQAYAPGVSAMNPCGLTPHQAVALAAAAGASPRVRCFDIMELSPDHDESGRTARLAAHLFLSFLRAFASRPA